MTTMMTMTINKYAPCAGNKGDSAIIGQLVACDLLFSRVGELKAPSINSIKLIECKIGVKRDESNRIGHS